MCAAFSLLLFNSDIQISLLTSSPSPLSAQTRHYPSHRVLPKSPRCLNRLPGKKCLQWLCFLARPSSCHSQYHFQKEPNSPRRLPAAGHSQLRVRQRLVTITSVLHLNVLFTLILKYMGLVLVSRPVQFSVVTQHCMMFKAKILLSIFPTPKVRGGLE